MRKMSVDLTVIQLPLCIFFKESLISLPELHNRKKAVRLTKCRNSTDRLPFADSSMFIAFTCVPHRTNLRLLWRTLHLRTQI